MREWADGHHQVRRRRAGEREEAPRRARGSRAEVRADEGHRIHAGRRTGAARHGFHGSGEAGLDRTSRASSATSAAISRRRTTSRRFRASSRRATRAAGSRWWCGPSRKAARPRKPRTSISASSRVRSLISSGSPLERDIGYSRAVVDGEWVFVSGTTGFDYSDDDHLGRCGGASRAVLSQHRAGFAGSRQQFRRSGARPLHSAPSRGFSRRAGPVLRKYFGEIRPAATMISAGLADPRMKIEIEVTARKS